jgi:hypothetical protein
MKGCGVNKKPPLGHDFREPWLPPITQKQWNHFLKHDFNSKTRESAAIIIEDWINRHADLGPFSLLEVGFGQCFDFRRYFLPMLNQKTLGQYAGYDITEQFVGFARRAFASIFRCCFHVGGFLDLKGVFDISYTRHTFEHQAPEFWKDCLRGFLNAAKHLAVISWFIRPREVEKLEWLEAQGFMNNEVGAYVNKLSKKKVLAIIAECGFRVQIVDFDRNNSIYVCERKSE